MNRKTLLGALNILVPVLLAFAIGAVFILALGKNPLTAYWYLIKQAFLVPGGFKDTLAYTSPLILTGLAIAMSFKSNIINMGVEGQMYIGAFAATWAGFTFDLPAAIHIPLCILCGIFFGSLFALIPALLKAYCHTNEMVLTLMLNYVAIIFCKYLTNGPFKQNIGYPATAQVLPSAMLPRLGDSTQLSASIFFGLACVVLIWFVYNKTKLGFEMDAIGKNIRFAEATGMNVKRKIIIIMVFSGAIAGLAGATEMLGVHRRFMPDFSTNPGLGWDGMLVALLGYNNPIGVLIAAIFFGAMKYGGTSMQMYVGVPNDVINVIQGLLILFLSVRFFKDTPAFRRVLAKITPAKGKAQAKGDAA